MTMRWSVEDRESDGRVVVISGLITEDADFQPVAALPVSGALRLDMAGVEQINSCGVRAWIQFLRGMNQEARQVELLRCSPAIVRQLNTLSNFRAGAAVRSVMLPYYCGDCGRQEYRMLEIPRAGKPPPIVETVPCPDCGRSAEFDDLPKSYIGFAA
jgi:ABC-type transporter Mla MlaB component